MFPSAGAATSPRRQSVTYPGYQAQYADYPPAHGGYGGHGPGEAAQSAAQWPGYHGLYTRYDADWNSVHHAATAAAALSAASHHFQPPSPAASAPHGSAEAGGDAGPGAGLYGGGVYVKPGSLCAPASGDFKPPILGDVRGLDDHGGEADPLRSQSGAVAGAGGRAHHSPDSGKWLSRYIVKLLMISRTSTVPCQVWRPLTACPGLTPPTTSSTSSSLRPPASTTTSPCPPGRSPPGRPTSG